MPLLRNSFFGHLCLLNPKTVGSKRRLPLVRIVDEQMICIRV